MRLAVNSVRQSLVVSLLVVGLCGCDREDSVESSVEEHAETPVNAAGRLLVSEAGSSKVRVMDLSSDQILRSFNLPYPVTALYSSPDFRYGLALQRNDNRVSIIDGGLYQENHGDHWHGYQKEPEWLAYGWDQVRPTHYEQHDGLAALFFDGLAEPYAPAKVAVFSDSSLAASRLEASLELPRNMHGTAEPRGEYLLATYRPDQSTTSSPTQVELYQRQAESYRWLKRFEPPCPGLHGSFSSHDFSVFGCTDGVLVIEQTASEFTARKIANPAGLDSPARIGTLLGDKEQDNFIGVAGDRLFAIDPVAGSIRELDWRQGQQRTRLAQGYSPDGQYLLLLDDQGYLHRWAALENYKPLSSLELGIQPVTGNLPVMVFNPAQPVAYISDPAGQKLHQVFLESAKVERLGLDFTPSKLAWIGIATEQTHAH